MTVVVVAGRFLMPLPTRGPSHDPTIADEQRPVPLADEHWGEPGASSLRCEGQSTHTRLGTDIYVEGHAWAPGGRPIERGEVAVSVGPCQKTALVFGERVWRAGATGPTPSRPSSFTSVPLRYEYCFGGSPVAATGSAALASERNPVGRGLYLREKDAIGGRLPELEDPQARIRSFGDRPSPAGFGPIARHWRPRRDHAGTYDDTWRQTRAPLWPKDVDVRLMNAAAPGLVAPRRLTGGESVRLSGMHVDGEIGFRLPFMLLQTKFVMRRRQLKVRMQLDGLRLAPDDGSFTLFWRATAVTEPDPFDLEHIIVRRLADWEAIL